MRADPTLAVVTASDEKFFPHLQNLLYSLARQWDPPDRVVVVDAGLTAEQRGAVLQSGASFIAPPGSAGRRIDPLMNVLDVRPQLDSIVDDVDLILWLDADLWLQSPAYLGDMRRFSRDYDLLVVPQHDASYRNGRIDLRVQAVPFGLARLSGWNFKLLAKAYGHAVACQMARQPSLNGGVFLARRRSAFWAEWRARYQASRHKAFGVDQISLILTHADAPIASATIDAAYNWVCHITCPVLDPEADFFRKPNPPHHVIGAIHMTAGTKDAALPIRRLGAEGERMVALYDPAVIAEAIRACGARTVEERVRINAGWR